MCIRDRCTTTLLTYPKGGETLQLNIDRHDRVLDSYKYYMKVYTLTEKEDTSFQNHVDKKFKLLEAIFKFT
jgi:hypothetical protein